MIDELDDLERKGIFTRQEIAEIVKQRRKFEYRLKRPSPLKQDFLAYIDYETQLDSLCRLRTKSVGRELEKQGDKKRRRNKKSVSDFAGVSRIIDIYRIAVTRFKGDLELWFRYLEFCKDKKNGRMKKDFIEQKRHKELANLSSFYRLVYSEIEEVGWEHLVRFGGDLEFLSFRITDNKGRVHVMEIQLDKTYPQKPPSVSAEVPYIFNVKWSVKSRLKDLVQQFREHLEKLQEFWSTMEDIDHSLCVTNKKELSRATICRQIDIGNDCLIMLSINAKDPSSLPECRFMGSGLVVNPVRKLWLRNNKRWMKDKTFPENLAFVLETELPRPSHVLENDQQVECGICYAQYLPMDEELGSRSGAGTDHTCDNTSCGRAFHTVCLVDWLRSITTTRQSFDVLFGNCPYCSEPVAVKLNDKRKHSF